MSAKAVLTVHEPGIQIKHHIWISWAEIAIGQEKSAQAARAAGLAAHVVAGDIAPHIAAETHAAMQSVAACAHSIDGLYGGVKPIIPLSPNVVDAWNANRASRHCRIRETFARGFRLQTGVPKAWKGEFTWLFGIRDDEVHFEERFQCTVPHPALPTQVSPEMAIYSLESARRATSLMQNVFEQLLRPGAGRTAETEKYAVAMDATKTRLISLRARA